MFKILKSFFAITFLSTVALASEVQVLDVDSIINPTGDECYGLVLTSCDPPADEFSTHGHCYSVGQIVQVEGDVCVVVGGATH